MQKEGVKERIIRLILPFLQIRISNVLQFANSAVCAVCANSFQYLTALIALSAQTANCIKEVKKHA